jgi:hypothetical protein
MRICVGMLATGAAGVVWMVVWDDVGEPKWGG